MTATFENLISLMMKAEDEDALNLARATAARIASLVDGKIAEFELPRRLRPLVLIHMTAYLASGLAGEILHLGERNQKADVLLSDEDALCLEVSILTKALLKGSQDIVSEVAPKVVNMVIKLRS